MISLNPAPNIRFTCPGCDTALETVSVHIPGMRALAELRCAGCGREFFGDLPTGHAIAHPTLLDQESGEVFHDRTLTMFAEFLRESYGQRVSTPVDFRVESFRPLHRPVLLNCLDWVYGHALLKLLNAQYYLDRQPEHDLIVMVPPALRWMVPAGVAEVWTVGLPFSRGPEWNDWIGAEVRRRLDSLEECWLALAAPHPHPDEVDIERFTRVSPFPLDRWGETSVRPVVTYVWRGDRAWGPEASMAFGARARRGVRRLLGLDPAPNPTHSQVIAFAEQLREMHPALDFAVAGLGNGGALPGWITDLRRDRPDEATEREWCERFARSHVVVGVHGSHMLLPSAHAGAVVEMVVHNRWESRWGNVIQDLLVRGNDIRDVLFRYRLLPGDTSPKQVAVIVASLIRYQWPAALHFRRESTNHDLLAERWARLREEWASTPEEIRPFPPAAV